MSNPPQKLACVGASITFGLGLPDRRAECYPAVLQTLLGDAWQVRNFGYSGATAGVATNEPYTKTPSMRSVVRHEPDAMVVMLGTNDAQHANRENLPRFLGDFADLLDQFQTLASRLWLVSPPPVFEPHAEIDIETLDQVIRPGVAKLGEKLALPVIDGYSPLKNRPDLFPDQLHPNAEGARILAEAIYRTVMED